MMFPIVLSLIFSNLVQAQTLSNAKELAVDADLNFFVEFIGNFYVSRSVYFNYASSHTMTFPQEIINYYYKEFDSSLSNLDPVISKMPAEFPFTQFKTFMTNFPWYSDMLSQVQLTDLYLPAQFTSSNALVSSLLGAALKAETKGTTLNPYYLLPSSTKSVTSETASSKVAATASPTSISNSSIQTIGTSSITSTKSRSSSGDANIKSLAFYFLGIQSFVYIVLLS